MTLVLSPKEARALWAVLNFSRVKGSPYDPDCMNVEDMARERLAEMGKPMSEVEMIDTMLNIWETLDKKVNA